MEPLIGSFRAGKSNVVQNQQDNGCLWGNGSGDGA